MAVNPSAVAPNADRYFPNDTSTLLQLGNTQEYLLQTVEFILNECPPNLPFASVDRLGRCYRGMFLGPTALAYFFLVLAEKQPNLVIDGKTPSEWCQAYLGLDQETVLPLLDVGCGVNNEFMAYNTVLACANKDVASALRVTSALEKLESDPGACEWLNGRAGGLYLLRVIRKYLPSITEEVNRVIRILIDEILAVNTWIWGGREYCGTVHGDIGILTQVVLSDPTYTAPKLEAKLSALLDLQEDNGNWPVIPTKEIGLIHFCHGAPGFVVSLLAIREFYPSLHERIDIAIERARKLIWDRGLLKKEPNICHGIIGNALALEGEQRAHFLEHATPKKVKEGNENGTFVAEDMGKFELLWGAAGRAWVWMDWETDNGKVILYTDV